MDRIFPKPSDIKVSASTLILDVQPLEMGNVKYKQLEALKQTLFIHHLLIHTVFNLAKAIQVH